MITRFGKTIGVQDSIAQMADHPILEESLKFLLMAFYVSKIFLNNAYYPTFAMTPQVITIVTFNNIML